MWVKALLDANAYAKDLRMRKAAKEAKKAEKLGGGDTSKQPEKKRPAAPSKKASGVSKIEGRKAKSRKTEDTTPKLQKLNVNRSKSALEVFFEQQADEKQLETKLELWRDLSPCEREQFEAQSDSVGLRQLLYDLDCDTQTFYPTLELQRGAEANSTVGSARMTTFFEKLEGKSQTENNEKKVKDDDGVPLLLSTINGNMSGRSWYVVNDKVFRSQGGEYLFQLTHICDVNDLCGVVFPCRSGLIPCYPLGYGSEGTVALTLASTLLYKIRMEILDGGARPLFCVRAIDLKFEGEVIEKRDSNIARCLMRLFEDLFEYPPISESIAHRFFGLSSPQVVQPLKKLGAVYTK
jgi:hypothetical protein